jgi:hypothetical protein
MFYSGHTKKIIIRRKYKEKNYTKKVQKRIIIQKKYKEKINIISIVKD